MSGKMQYEVSNLLHRGGRLSIKAEREALKRDQAARWLEKQAAGEVKSVEYGPWSDWE